MKTTKKTRTTQSFSLWEKVAGIACRMRVIHNITNSHQLKDSSRWSQPASLIGIDHSRLNPLMAISPILIFAFLLPLSFNLLTGATALAVAPTIGLSILATDGNTNNNVTIQSPSGGGIAVGRHTLVINTNSYKGYNVTLNSNSSNSNLTNTNGNNSNNNIVPVAGTLTNPTSLTVDNTWGVAIPGKPGFGQDSDYTSTNTAAKYAAVPASSTTTNNSILTKTSPSNTAGDNQPVVYGVKTASLTKAGSYKATVTYTATAQLPAKPTITSITPNSYQLGTDIATNPNASKITITGTDLGSTNEVYIDTNGNSQKDTGEECTNLTIQSDNIITCNVPTADVNAGTYDVHLSAQGGETIKTGGFTYKAADIPVESISLTCPSSVDVGEVAQVSATVKPANATDKAVAFGSSDTELATIDASGQSGAAKVTGKKAGSVQITALTHNGKSAECTVQINSKSVISGDIVYGFRNASVESSPIGFLNLLGVDSNVVKGGTEYYPDPVRITISPNNNPSDGSSKTCVGYAMANGGVTDIWNCAFHDGTAWQWSGYYIFIATGSGGEVIPTNRVVPPYVDCEKLDEKYCG